MIKNLTLFAFLMCFVQLTAQDNKAFPMKFAFRHSDTMRAALPITSISNTGCTVYNTFRNELWMSSSHNDSILRFSVPKGQYLGAVRATGLVAPITNTTRQFRGLTVKDNYYIWGVNNTDTIRKIDPTTAQEVARFVVPKWMGNQSFITFDSTKGGAFWISSTSYVFRRVDSSFTTVTDSIVFDGTFKTSPSILTFDALSAGGPYLWAFGSPHPETVTYGFQNNFATATQISIATKKRTGIQKSLVDDFTFFVNNNQAARGMTIAQIPGFPKPMMILTTGKFTSGASQLLASDISGVTAAYELSTTVTPDAAVDTVLITPNYSMLPPQFVSPVNVKVLMRNVVSNATTAGDIRIVTRGPAGDTLNNQLVPFSTNAATSAFFNVPNVVSGFKKGVNRINARSIVPNDPLSRNDTLTAILAISDSTIARDYVDFFDMKALTSFIYGGAKSLYHSLGTGITALIPERPEIGQGYKLGVPITITTVTVRMTPFRSGDTTRVKVYKLDANGKPQYAAQSALYQISAADSAAQRMTLALTAPLDIAANQEFMISVTEGFNAPYVWGTPMGYEKGKTFVHSLVSFKGWATTDTISTYFGNPSTYFQTDFQRALAIRPNIRLRTDIGETTNIGKLLISPNPTSGVINLAVDMVAAEDVLVRVYNLSGQLVYTSKFDKVKNIQQEVDLTQNANGVYVLSLTTAKGTLTRKVVKE